jgi:hypothetical protein
MTTEKTYLLVLRKAVMNGYGSSVSEPCIGIAHRKLLFNDKIRIVISQTDKDGHPLFPYEYEITSAEALNYPKWYLPDGITPVHIIPIKRLTQLISDPNPKSFKTTVKKANAIAKRMAKYDPVMEYKILSEKPDLSDKESLRMTTLAMQIDEKKE